jgi:hypothetical protein
MFAEPMTCYGVHQICTQTPGLRYKTAKNDQKLEIWTQETVKILLSAPVPGRAVQLEINLDAEHGRTSEGASRAAALPIEASRSQNGDTLPIVTLCI